jgi:hypothetical protein
MPDDRVDRRLLDTAYRQLRFSQAPQLTACPDQH